MAVHVVLVSDLLVLLTERDQKYHLATLQDFKPPVIRLYDLHVRLDAAVKSGVQLLLLEKGPSPEMFRLQFVTKSEAKVWDSTLNSAIEECKKKGLTAEYFGEFGGEKLLSGDEEKKQEGESDQEDVAMSHKKDAPKAVSIQETTITITSSAGAIQRAKDSLDLAGRLLTQLSSPSTSTADANSAQRYHGAAASSGLSRPFLRDSPKNRQRSHTGQHVRPKTAFYHEDPEVGGGSNSSTTMPGEHIITLPIPPGVFTGKGSKQGKEKKKTKLDRSATFKGKEKEKDRDKPASTSGGGEGTESSRVPDQQVVECITKMKEALEEMVTTCEEKEEELEYLRKEKDQKIAKLQDEIAHLREVIQLTRSQEDQSPLMSRHNSHSHSHARPHSVHIDLSDRDELVDSGEIPSELSFRPRLGNMMNKNLNVKSSLKQASGRETADHHQSDNSSSQETENLNVADTGT